MNKPSEKQQGRLRREKNAKSGRWILKRIRPFIPGLVILMAIVTVISYISVQFALVSKNLIDTATRQSGGSVAEWAVKLSALLLFQLVLQAVYIRIHVKISGRLAMAVRTDIFYKLLQKDFSSVSEIHSGEVLNRLVSDVSIVSEKITEMIPNVVALVTTLVFSFSALFVLDRYFAVACLAFGPVVLAAAYIYRKKIKKLHLQCRESDGKVRSFLQETIQNFLVVKAFGRETVMRSQSEGLQYDNFRLNVKRSTVGILANVMFFVAVTAGYYAALAWSVYRLSLGLITFGTLTAVLGLVGQFQAPFRELAGIFPQYYMVLASVERLMELEDLKDETTALPVSGEKLKDFSCIKAEDVTFSYDAVPVLNRINFMVKKGEFVALCGGSGAGKSTLAKLLLAVLKPAEGEVSLQFPAGDKEPLGAGTRKLFSYVPQGNMILSGTIRDNITFADENPDEERVARAAELAQLADVIDNAPKGLDTMLGEKGRGLSEGQVQRIAIARALYYDAPVLLLDEATSALDLQTEDRLLKTIRQMTDKTVIIISHRKEVMEACDKTYILQDGTLDVLT